MNRIFYLLPADYCRDAVARYQIAKDDALRAKHDLMNKYGCVALLRQGHQVLGLAYSKPVEKSGFTVPKKHEGYWVIKPKNTTLVGRRVRDELNECGELLELWQWALEKSLGVDGCVLDREGFHKLVAHALSDGRVILNAPDGKNCPSGPNVSRNFEDPVIPDCAVKISREEALMLMKSSDVEEC